MMSKHQIKNKNNNRQRSDITIPRDPSYTAFGHFNQAPLAQRLRTTLRYSETIARTGLAAYDYVYNLNGLFDPNQTGTGHQPKGFDQLAALYQRYRVFATRYKVIFSPNVSSIPVHCIVAPTNSLTAYVDASDIIEAPFSKNRVSIVYADPPTISGFVDLATLNGKSRTAYAADDTTQALVTANPSEQLALHVFSESVDGSTTITTYFTILLEFDVEFSDAKQLAPS